MPMTKEDLVESIQNILRDETSEGKFQNLKKEFFEFANETRHLDPVLVGHMELVMKELGNLELYLTRTYGKKE